MSTRQNPHSIYGGDFHARITSGFAGKEHDETTGVSGMTFSGEGMRPIDNDLDNYLNPLFESTIRQIVQEVEEMRLAGTLKPFVEGEHLGKLPRGVRPKKMTAAQARAAHNQRMQQRQEDMLALRKRNDGTIEALLSRRLSWQSTSPATPPSATT
jgi:hypothetical protein